MSLSYGRHLRLAQLPRRPRVPRNEIQAYQALTQTAVRQIPTSRPLSSSFDGRPRSRKIAGVSYSDLDAVRGIGYGVLAGLLMWAGI